MMDYSKTDTTKYQKHYNENSFWKKIGKVARKVGEVVVLNALKLFYAMKMGKLSVGQVAIVVGALGYFISPLDLLPDLTPLVGYVDDAAVLAAAVATISACTDPQVVQAAKDKLKELF